MKKKLYTLPVKMLIIFLFLLSLLGIFVFGGMTVVNAENDVYSMSENTLWQGLLEPLTRKCNGEVYRQYEGYYDTSGERMNYRYNIYSEEGEFLGGNYEGEETQYTLETWYDVWTEHWNNETQEYETNCEMIRVVGYVLKSLSGYDEFTVAWHWMNIWYEFRYAAIALLIVIACVAVVLFVLLMCSAGHQKGSEEAVLNRVTDRIPFDLYTVIYIGVLFIPLALASAFWGHSVFWILALCVMLILSEGLLFLAYTMSFAARIKTGGLLHSMIIYRVWNWFWRGCKAIGRGIRAVIAGLPLLWQTILLLAVLSLIELFVLAQAWLASEVIKWWFLEKIILVPLIIWVVLMMRKIQQAGKEISQGRLEAKVDTRHMAGPFREHAEDLNSINDGISRAVDARMKSEHFRTELITNVSHDIKTPLTSIINYVNLIKKEDPQDETLREYIAVLDRQSVRLKKLIEDLVEASKASTGNLPVNMAPCEVGVLLGQAVGEYEEKLQENSLDLQLIMPEDTITIMADGRHLWRVFDNLLNNICKYSQPQTRVYLNLENREGRAIITFRNISRYALNISSEELMERFVRGDGSRHTEGSGLGLSIARSLVELQNGTIDLIVDGDLFKVILSFQTV